MKKRIRLQAMRDMTIEILVGEFVYCYTDHRSFSKIYESGK